MTVFKHQGWPPKRKKLEIMEKIKSKNLITYKKLKLVKEIITQRLGKD